MPLALIWLHVSGNIVWIGSILAVAAVMVSSHGDAKTRGELALGIYKRLAVPGFIASFVFGATRLLLDVPYYLKQHHWMHGKLLFAVIVIALHHIIGARAKKLSRGTVQSAGPAAILAAILAVAAVGAAAFVIFKVPD